MEKGDEAAVKIEFKEWRLNKRWKTEFQDEFYLHYDSKKTSCRQKKHVRIINLFSLFFHRATKFCVEEGIPCDE